MFAIRIQIQKTISLTILIFFVIIMFPLNSVFGYAVKDNHVPNFHQVKGTTLTNQDTIPFATVILYRPDNQWSRKYKLSTSISRAFEMSKNEMLKIDVQTNTFSISVDAAGHKKESFKFDLSQSKTHYFRIQDRNNYSGFLVFLEVIEVTEDTFKNDRSQKKRD